jgi:hypothetical protein
VFAEQAGAATRRQLLDSGLTEETIRARLRSGRWRTAYKGVYWTFSGSPPRAAALWTAVLTAGRGAVLSHETAAELLGLAPSTSPLLHVSVPPDRRIRPVAGVRVHHRSTPPVAVPARWPPRTGIVDTVLDLTQTCPTVDDALAWLVKACGNRLTTPDRLLTGITARGRLRWREALVTAVADVDAGCHSLLELRYLRDVERPHGLPVGVRQQRIRTGGGATVYRDVEYARFGVVTELDGRAAHLDPARDHRRDNAAAADGLVTLRFGWADVNLRPCMTAIYVWAALRSGGWAGLPARCGPGCLVPQQREGSPGA